MGMFDTVYMNCRKCGKNFEEQSKGGECTLANYGLDTAPIDVLSGLDRKNITCPYCGTEHEIVIKYMTSMRLKEDDDFEFNYMED